MSLINDVLRQLDSKPIGNTEVNSILPAALIEKDNEKDTLKIAITVVGILIFVIYLSQVILGQPLLSLLTNTLKQEGSVQAPFIKETINEEIANIAPVNLEAVNLEAVNLEAVNLEAVNLEAVNLEAVDIAAINIQPKEVSTAQIIIETELKEVELKEIEIKEVEIKEKKTSKIIPVKKIAEQPKGLGHEPVAIPESVIINKQEKSWEDNQYQVALRYFIDGNISESDRLIKQVLNSQVSDEYLGLQARIYIKQDDANSFYELVKNNSGSNSLEWYKLVAPGLQLFSYYQLSNQYYYSIADIEPQQIRWQLAIALNYLRLDKDDKALPIYHKLYQSEQTSNRQKQWLKNKIQRISLNKA